MRLSPPLWLESFQHELNSCFVLPENPQIGSQVTISMKLWTSAPIKKAYLHGIWDGADVSFEMTKSQAGPLFTTWQYVFTLKQPYLNYSFIVDDDSHYWYITRRGITSHFPTEDHDWVINTQYQGPEWVSSSVVYQIFPDRFFRSRRTGGVETGEITSWGHKSLAMAWTDKPLEWEEGHCMDFYNGDLDGIRKKIPYLKDLGVGCVYLTPIFQAPSVHKYDCTDYFHVDPHLGGDKALVKLSQELHDQGMKLILDISINHVGFDHPWIADAMKNPQSKYRDFFYWNDQGHPVGWLGNPGLPQLNYTSAALKKLMWEGKNSVLRKYLKAPFLIDGWRFDVGAHTGRLGEHQMGNEIWRQVRKAIKEENPQAWIFGEHWHDNISYHQGDQWDGAMNYPASARPLRHFAGELDRFIFNQLYAINHEPASGWDFVDMVMQHIARIPPAQVFQQVNLLDSHDIHRFHTNTDRYNWDLYRGMMFTLFLLPGTPMIYYGDETALGGWTTSIEGCRLPFDWKPGHWNQDFLHLYRSLAHLKNGNPVLDRGLLKFLYADETTVILARTMGERAYLGTLNRDRHPKVIRLDSRILGIKKAREIFLGKTALSSEDIFEIRLTPGENQLWEADLEA